MKINLRKVLGVLTDILTFGRGKGWWKKGHVPQAAPGKARKLALFLSVLALTACIKWPPTFPPTPPPASPSPSATPPATPTPPPSPSPTPTATPTPSPTPTVPPSTPPSQPPGTMPNGNYPAPPEGECNANYVGGPTRVGVAMLSQRPCSGNCKKDGYLGYIINMSATPKDRPPRCWTTGRIECEQWKGCQDPAGVEFRMSLAGGWQNEECDRRSDNPYNCHHKPRAGETGITTFETCKRGDPPGGPTCSTTRVEVGPNGAREIRGLVAAPRAKRKPTVWAPGER